MSIQKITFLSSYFDLKVEHFQAKDSSDCHNIMQSQTEKKVEVMQNKTKSFASTQNFRPIVPFPQICDSPLKPIQPKPKILPGKSLSLCLEKCSKKNRVIFR